MRACIFLALVIVALLVLASVGDARSKRKHVRAEGEASTEHERHRGNKQHGKDRRDKKGRGQSQEPSNGEKDVMVAFEDIQPVEETAVDVPPEETVPEEPQEIQEEPANPASEVQPPKRGHKKGHKGEKNRDSGRVDKAARRAAKEERKRLRHEKQAIKETRKEGKAARKAARKEARKEENKEKKQARKDAKHHNISADCEEHAECPAGSCCQERDAVKQCRIFSKAEGSICFDDCACADGMECFVREGKKAKHPEGDAKGRCRMREAVDMEDKAEMEEMPAENEE